MVILVLPLEARTEPRFPFEKSYSLRMVLLRFTSAAPARGDQPNAVAARRMDNDKDPAESIHAERHVSRLPFRVGIFDGYREGITKRLFGVRETDPVLGQVCPGFDRIELDVHGTSMHMLCILSRPTQCGERAKAANVGVHPPAEAGEARRSRSGATKG